MYKHIHSLPALLLAATLCFTACADKPNGDEATVTEEQMIANAVGGQIYTVDASSSKIRFTGYGVGKSHPGNFKLTEGRVLVNGDQVAGGDFTININSMEMEEQGAIFENKLKPHLLSGDFFDAAQYSNAKFEITGVEPFAGDGKDTSIVAGANFSVSGNLTLKGITKNVTFPAKVAVEGNTLMAKANFNIDRREWQMNYGNDNALGDKFISETVNVQVDIVANK